MAIPMAERMTRRDHHAETTRRDILAAGREIFSQHPYSEASGLQICNQAGVTRGPLQHHFGSKLGLYMAGFEGLQDGVSLHLTEATHYQPEAWQLVPSGNECF